MSAASARRSAWLVPTVIVVVAVLLVTVSLLLSDDGEDTDAGAPESPVAEVQGPEEPTTVDLARLEEGDPLAAGTLDAPVTLIVYSDFQCPFCASWATDTGPVMHEYVEAGDLRIEYRDITIFGEESENAAHAAYAAGLQDSYLEYHDALFPDGDKRPAEQLTEEALIDLAGELGLDTEQFAADYGSPEVAQAVQRNVDEAAQIGAFSTPAFLLAGQPILGAQPTETFVTAMDQALADSGA